MEKRLFEQAKRIQALAKTGLNYTENHYDVERFEELYQISSDILAKLTHLKLEQTLSVLAEEPEYPTPKTDIRAVVFKEEKILLVKESSDERWALPGGWADIGYSPAEVAVKEVEEEAGLQVEATRLLAVLDNCFHGHPPSLHHIYKIFIACQILGGSLRPSPDILDVGFFKQEDLPPLSQGRVSEEEIIQMFAYRQDANKEVWWD